MICSTVHLFSARETSKDSVVAVAAGDVAEAVDLGVDVAFVGYAGLDFGADVGWEFGETDRAVTSVFVAIDNMRKAVGFRHHGGIHCFSPICHTIQFEKRRR